MVTCSIPSQWVKLKEVIRCTCGAYPPEDARFCHKCARPLFDDPVVEPDPADVPAPETQAGALPQPVTANNLPSTGVPSGSANDPITLSTPGIVKHCLMIAGLIALLNMISVPAPVGMIWLIFVLIGGGFLSVLSFQRRRQFKVSAVAGARLGWITGLFAFLINVVFLAIDLVILSSTDKLIDAFLHNLRTAGTQQTSVDQISAMLSTPVGMGALLFSILLLLFMFFTMLTSIGGAIGGRFLARR